MKRKSFNRKENSWFGLAKLILVVSIIALGTLLFVVSSKYFDPSFKSGYLIGRSHESLDLFRVMVLVHLISASLLLLITTFLVFYRIEEQWPSLHRISGKIVLLTGILALVPSGYYLSYFALGGLAGKLLFSLLTSLSLISLINIYRQAIQRSFHAHRKWVIRFYIFLTSALWLRLNMFIIFYHFGSTEKNYLIAALLSWVPQLLIFEFIHRRK